MKTALAVRRRRVGPLRRASPTRPSSTLDQSQPRTNRQHHTRRCAAISRGGTEWSGRRYRGSSPQIPNADTSAARPRCRSPLARAVTLVAPPTVVGSEGALLTADHGVLLYREDQPMVSRNSACERPRVRWTFDPSWNGQISSGKPKLLESVSMRQRGDAAVGFEEPEAATSALLVPEAPEGRLDRSYRRDWIADQAGVGHSENLLGMKLARAGQRGEPALRRS